MDEKDLEIKMLKDLVAEYDLVLSKIEKLIDRERESNRELIIRVRDLEQKVETLCFLIEHHQ